MRLSFRSFVAVLGIAAAVVLPACHSDSHKPPTLNPPPAVPAVARKVSVAFVDAATGRLVTAPIKATVVDGSGNRSGVTLDKGGRQ
jgi:hypothetical protein